MLKKILPETDTFSEILDDIVFETRRASEIIIRMRSFLKRGEIQFVSMNVNDVIPDVIDFKRCDLVGKNIVIVTDLQKQIPLVKVDVIQLQQILLNIVSNACDAMKDSTTSCRLIRITTHSSDRNWVEILVTDHGTGIAEADLERIFDPFYTTKK